MSGTEEQLRARTKVCSRCRKEKAGTEYTIFRNSAGTLTLMSRCKPCRATKEALNRELGVDHVSRNPGYMFPAQEGSEGLARNKAYFDKFQSESLEQATNNRKEWTGPELELLARKDLKARELAEMLNRTLHSVRRMRAKIIRDPQKRVLAGIAEAVE